MSIFAVRMRLRSALTTTVGMPFSGAAFAPKPEAASTAGAGAPTARPEALVALGADCAHAARKSGAARRTASLRIVFTSFQRSCLRRRQPGWLGSPALPEEVPGVPGDLPGEVPDLGAALSGQRGVRRGDVQRFVSPPAGILGRQIGGVGLREEPLGGNLPGRGALRVAAGVRDRARERDVDTEGEPCRELVDPLAVAMDHASDGGGLAEDGAHSLAPLADGNDDRAVDERGER